MVRGWFPGGVLFVDLRGYDPQGKVTAEQALGALLRALGIRGEDMPPTQEERAALYRSELARLADERKPVLLVADNASTPDQVAPLLPARHEHRALVTSRDILATLPARQLRLRQMASADARDLIATTLTGADPDDARLDRQSDALDEVVGSCGGLPLALKIAAARLTGDPGLPLATFAAELADSRTRLGSLHYDDDSVRTAFALSFRRLAPVPARLFRLLPLAPGSDISTEAASALLGRPARGELADLTRAALLSEEPVGSGRWRMHDLIRLFATGLSHEDSARQRARAQKRLLRYYATTARSATRFLWGRAEGGTSGPFTSREEAVAWLEAERPSLVAATRFAAVAHIDLAVDLTYGVSIFLHRWGYVDDNLAILSAVVPHGGGGGPHSGGGRAPQRARSVPRRRRAGGGGRRAITGSGQSLAADRTSPGVRCPSLGVGPGQPRLLGREPGASPGGRRGSRRDHAPPGEGQRPPTAQRRVGGGPRQPQQSPR